MFINITVVVPYYGKINIIRACCEHHSIFTLTSAVSSIFLWNQSIFEFAVYFTVPMCIVYCAMTLKHGLSNYCYMWHEVSLWYEYSIIWELQILQSLTLEPYERKKTSEKFLFINSLSPYKLKMGSCCLYSFKNIFVLKEWCQVIWQEFNTVITFIAH